MLLLELVESNLLIFIVLGFRALSCVCGHLVPYGNE
jgi:hypothetical protein